MTEQLAVVVVPRRLATLSNKSPALFLPDAKAAERFFDFFTSNIRNKNTRRAYYKAVCRFADWCEGRGVADLARVKPFHIAAYIEALTAEMAKPSVKQHLAAIRMLLDWLLAAINTATLTGLRDRALIGTMIYTFARIGAVLQMNVGDYFTQGRRGWVRLHEKGGKEHEAPCHHKLEAMLDAYLAAAGIADDREGALFRTTGRSSGLAQRMGQSDAYRMIQRRARQAGIETKIGNHSLRATGITDYLTNNGTLEHAQQMANHSSPRTTKLYDRRHDEVALEEYERVGI